MTPSPSPSITQTDEPPATGESPDESLAIYCSLVDAGLYEESWNRLSPEVQSQQDGGYAGYVEYYENLGLCGVWLEDPIVTELIGSSATVNTVLVHDFCGGDIRRYEFDYYMIYAADRELWLIDGTARR